MVTTKRVHFCLLLCFASYSARAQVSPDGPRVILTPQRSQAPAKPDSDIPVHIRVDTSLVLIPVQATTLSGSPVTDLNAQSFRVLEDGVEQQISNFSKDDAPISVGLVFDSSGSMGNKMQKSAEAAAAFFKTANREDEFFLVAFGDRPRLRMPFTYDSDQIYEKIAHTRAFGRTSLIDAIHLALMQMKNAKNSRKALVILSDGGDNRSRFTRQELKDEVLESDVQMHAMGIFNTDLIKQTPEEENGPRLLGELAEQSGGRLYTVSTIESLNSIGARLGNALHNQYLVGYLSTNPNRDGKYRRVKVDLAKPSDETRITYRRGYYAPAQ